MTSQPLPPIEVAIPDPTWLAHRYDPVRDTIHFIPVTRHMHREATFLTDDHLPAGLTPLVVRRDEAIASTVPAAPIHFVFHSAYCCSTLVARAFDRPGVAMGLKEPVVFNDIAGWRTRGGHGADMAAVLDDVLTLTARPFAAGEAVIVKPSNIINGLAAAILALRPAARAVLLRAPLSVYLASITKKGLEGRLWVRELMVRLIDDGVGQFGFNDRDLLGQTDLQISALGWLAQERIFAGLVARYGPDRVRTLDSETLIANPADATRQMARLFGLSFDDAMIRDIVDGPVFNRHSKLGAAFSAIDRAADHRIATREHADEIGKVLLWAERVGEAAGIVMPEAAALTGKMDQ